MSYNTNEGSEKPKIRIREKSRRLYQDVHRDHMLALPPQIPTISRYFLEIKQG